MTCVFGNLPAQLNNYGSQVYDITCSFGKNFSFMKHHKKVTWLIHGLRGGKGTQCCDLLDNNDRLHYDQKHCAQNATSH